MGRMGPIFLGHVSFAQKDLSIEARKGQSGMGFLGVGSQSPPTRYTGWRKKRGHRPSYLIANIPKTP